MRDDLQAGEQLPLVLVDPLHLHDEHRVGRQLDAGAARAPSSREVALVRLLDRVERVEEVLVVGERQQALQARRARLVDPAGADAAR